MVSSTHNAFMLDTEQLDKVFKKEKFHGCLISKENEEIYQFFKNKKSEKKQHKINSCTKSITSALIGIAYDKGYIPDLNTPISTYFPTLLNDQDNKKRSITVDHLLTMTAGFDWPEMGEWRGWPGMIHSPNWVNFTLQRPLVSEPGEKMNYNSGCSHLLLAILQKQTGATAREFAQRYLFTRLDFADFLWHEDPQGINIGGFGIHLSIRDLHMFGMLYLNRGRWNKKQLISEEWIDRTTEPENLTYPHFGHYGHHWWTSKTLTDEPFYFAMGMGGQYTCILPTRQMVVTMVNDTYADSGKPLHILRDVILNGG
ncbi:serine hydrolase domain-containing protein [Aureibacillus halotolerans]|uniref:Beta-lactamase-related domain-containing protein n=1 Tax=Aureibacillus halotolerans TaxID=1508390 RepID=A0A4R6TTG0_9BACI|nr:serine hydrolase [Aureibacillus halotolerans]TDQ33757.1 hypothetical protein EV213_12924 [Aureibacillus halotolerans]